jgi:Bacteriophage Mu transposase
VAEAITNVCEEHGIPAKLLTDNGGAINSRRITGGLRPRYRTVQQRAADWDVPGVMAIYGIELQNTAPAHRAASCRKASTPPFATSTTRPSSTGRKGLVRPIPKTPTRT